MELNEYQQRAHETAVYPGQGNILGLLYTALKLNGEAGEVAEKVGKLLRDKQGELDQNDVRAICKELGDVLWYVSETADQLGIRLGDVAQLNLDKLNRRRENDTLHGEGDDR